MVSTERLVLWVSASSKNAKDAVLSRVGLAHEVLYALACQANQGYDPRNSLVKDDGLADFIKAPVTGDLTEVVFSRGQERGYVAGRSQLAMTTTGVVWRGIRCRESVMRRLSSWRLETTRSPTPSSSSVRRFNKPAASEGPGVWLKVVGGCRFACGCREVPDAEGAGQRGAHGGVRGALRQVLVSR